MLNKYFWSIFLALLIPTSLFAQAIEEVIVTA